MFDLNKVNTAVVLVVYCLITLLQNPSQPKLASSIAPIGHIAAHYVDPAPGLTLAFYFKGEEIKFSVSFYNEGQAPIHLGWARSDIQKCISFQWIKLPKEQPVRDIFLEPYELVIRPKDGALTQVEKVANLEPGDSVAVRWRLRTINDIPLAPGRYELTASPLLPSSQQKGGGEKVALIINNHHVFEVREAVTLKDNIERLLRDAIWAAWRGDYDRAIQNLNQVLTLNPNSEFGYEFLGKFNSERGRYADAVRAYQRAIEIMESDLDRLIPEYRKRSPNWNSAIQRLKQQLEITKAKIK